MDFEERCVGSFGKNLSELVRGKEVARKEGLGHILNVKKKRADKRKSSQVESQRGRRGHS